MMLLNEIKKFTLRKVMRNIFVLLLFITSINTFAMSDYFACDVINNSDLKVLTSVKVATLMNNQDSDIYYLSVNSNEKGVIELYNFSDSILIKNRTSSLDSASELSIPNTMLKSMDPNEKLTLITLGGKNQIACYLK
jgi:hypothetical protein